jgi:hypothetical protein
MIKDIDFQYYLNVDYETVYDCENFGCTDICRCSEIRNEKVLSINKKDVINRIYEYYFDDSLESIRNSKIDSIIGDISTEIDIYSIDRILSIHKINNNDNWDISKTNGYYGEEIEEITLNIDIQKDLDNAFKLYTLKDRMEYLLKLEYNYLLDDIIDKNYSIEEIDIELLDFPQKSHLRKISKEKSLYENYDLIFGITIFKNNRYKLIDGYHRCSETKNKKIKVIVIN